MPKVFILLLFILFTFSLICSFEFTRAFAINILFILQDIVCDTIPAQNSKNIELYMTQALRIRRAKRIYYGKINVISTDVCFLLCAVFSWCSLIFMVY